MFVKRHSYINNTLCRRLLGANHNRAAYLLKKMAKKGLLIREGINRATSYCLPPIVGVQDYQ